MYSRHPLRNYRTTIASFSRLITLISPKVDSKIWDHENYKRGRRNEADELARHLSSITSRDIYQLLPQLDIIKNPKHVTAVSLTRVIVAIVPGSAFIKRDQSDPWIKDQIKNILLSTISPLQLPNFVSCGRDKPSHMTQNLVTVGTKLWTAERFLVDPWSMDQADLVW